MLVTLKLPPIDRKEGPWCKLQQQQAAVRVKVSLHSASETCGQAGYCHAVQRSFGNEEEVKGRKEEWMGDALSACITHHHCYYHSYDLLLSLLLLRLRQMLPPVSFLVRS